MAIQFRIRIQGSWIWIRIRIHKCLLSSCSLFLGQCVISTILWRLRYDDGDPFSVHTVCYPQNVKKNSGSEKSPNLSHQLPEGHRSSRTGLSYDSISRLSAPEIPVDSVSKQQFLFIMTVTVQLPLTKRLYSLVCFFLSLCWIVYLLGEKKTAE